MYLYVDRPCVALAPGSRFVLAAMREWVAAVREGRCACRALAPGFAAAGARDVLAPFQMMMAILNRDGLRPLGFGARCRQTVAEDEAVLLGLLDQAGSERARVDAARALVAADMVPALSKALAAVAAGLIDAPASRCSRGKEGR
ncbi:hypothetical protein [Sphingosinicella sp. BN140058]|uniref:hypothetical protein n=1 Tax=Sphingosinicella sp. BN140058 TaxID=1892855 RepID=UPI001012C043|nr:hypothetical protein [Sphingosinicella sp. BN140058]QAY77319.1 hypothetical protein ETR14_13005 [Sphingosinicella sp. BN140058]